MSTFLVGDIHGCFDELQLLLAQVDFNPNQDVLWLTGDLVARGPDSLKVLRYVRSLGDSARIVLGNHDLHLLAIYAGISRNKPRDNLTELLEAPECDELLNWLRKQPVVQIDHEKKIIMTHAGVSPQWNDAETIQRCAYDIEAMLRSDSYPLFLDSMYGDLPNSWDETLTGLPKLRFCTNVLTRMRYCYPDGSLDMLCKESPAKAPFPLKPWFDIPNPLTDEYSIVFGHWAALEGKGAPEGIYPLDTGCCWGGALTLLCWEDQRYFHQPALKRNKD